MEFKKHYIPHPYKGGVRGGSKSMVNKVHNFKKYKKRRQYLRNNSTKSEQVLWNKLRNSKLGFKFRRQHGIDRYIVDFYCPKLKVVIEIDGYVHGESLQITKDLERQLFLENLGFKVLRYRNEQVLFELEAVVQDIANHCNEL